MDYLARTRQLETHPIGWLILTFSIPAITAAVISASHTVVNRIIVGHFLDNDAVAAVTLSIPIMTVMLAAGMMISIGSGSLISIRLGEKKQDEAEQIVGQALYLYVFLSVGFFLFGMLFQDPMLRLFKANEAVIPQAKSYISVMVCGAFFHQMSFGVNGLLRAEGRVRTAMTTALIAAILNIVFDLLFLGVFKTPIWGAGMATILAQFFSMIWVIRQYCTGRTLLRWRWKYIRWQAPLAKAVFMLGLPPFIMQCLNCVLQIIQMAQLGKYGLIYGQQHGIANGDTLAHSAIGIIIPISMVIFFPLLGLNQGVQPIVGYNIGARHFDRVARTLWLTLTGAVIFALICTLTVLLFPEPLLRLFVDMKNADNQELLRLGTHAMHVFILMFPAATLCVVASGYFQANGMPKKAIILTLLRQVVALIPLMLILPPLMQTWDGFNGMDGIWYAMPLADLTAGSLSFVFLFREFRRLKRNRLSPACDNVDRPAQNSQTHLGL